jgi:hypothetical protein
MTRFTNILAAVALATAFLPIAANATTMAPLHQVQIVAHQTLSGPLPEVQRVADVAPMQGQVLQSGATDQVFGENESNGN